MLMIPPLISASDLQKLDTSNTVIFDCRFSLADVSQGEQQYHNNHIPGARYLHLNRDLSGPVGKHGGRHPLPSADAFGDLMRQHGVNHDTQVIAYDDQRMAFASRLWWLLRYFGHEQVQILNGGLQAWINNSGTTDDQIPEAPQVPGNFTAQADDFQLVDYQNIKAHINDPGRLLIDSREERRYRGLEEPIDPIAGHIPGAENFPWQGVTNESGLALSPATQQKRWKDLPRGKELVIYCGSGVTACVNLLSLELAGINGAKLYAGSWSDWCSYLSTDNN